MSQSGPGSGSVLTPAGHSALQLCKSPSPIAGGGGPQLVPFVGSLLHCWGLHRGSQPSQSNLCLHKEPRCTQQQGPCPSRVNPILCRLWLLTRTSGEGIQREIQDALSIHTCLPQSRTLPGQLWLSGSPFTRGLLARRNRKSSHRSSLLPGKDLLPGLLWKTKSSQDPWCGLLVPRPGGGNRLAVPGDCEWSQALFPCRFLCPSLPPLTCRSPQRKLQHQPQGAMWISALCPWRVPWRS